MFPQPTSLQAYAELVRDGRITKDQLLVWTVLQAHGPLTGREIDHHAERVGLWKRISELHKLGLVVVCPPRKCSVSRHHSVTWRIVGEDEVPPSPRRTRPRRRFWIAIVNMGDVDCWEACATEAEARQAAGEGEVIEVREVMRGHQKPTMQEDTTCSSQL